MNLNANHVNPSTSSGSSPGVALVLAPRLLCISASAEHLGTSSSFAPSKSLVVNKRKLPAVLRNDVPPLHIAGTAAESLIVTPNRLPGVLNLDVGKQIQHRAKTVRILNVHENIRLVVPLGEEEHRAFWIPRRAVNRGDFKKERITRHYVAGIKKAFVGPHWTGESRPRAETVTLPPWEKLISEDLYTLTKSLGKYENRLIPESSYWDMVSALPPTRHEGRLLEQKTRQKYAALREKLRERLLRQILEESRLPEEKQIAVYDVLGLGQVTEQAAAARRVSPVSLENTVRRITTKVNQAYQAALQAVYG
jgi:hypothetical protein